MSRSTNEWLRDEQIGRQVDLAQYSNSVVRRILALLGRTDADLAGRLMVAVERAQQGASQLSADRLDSLLVDVRAVLAKAYNDMSNELQNSARGVTGTESAFQFSLFHEAAGPGAALAATAEAAGVVVQVVNVEQVYGAALARPFQGKLLKEWVSSLEADAAERIRDTIRKGIVENLTNDEIVRSIRGTRAEGFADGIIALDRRNAEAVVRTAVQHVAAFTRDRFMQQNEDLITGYQWLSTLDLRTTPACQIRDGLEYDLDHHPVGHSVPWGAGPGRLHWGCRSTSTPILKSWRELGIPIDDEPKSTRASMDGQVPEDTTYGEWLKAQSAARQDEVLGPTRGQQFRDGTPFDRFFNNKGLFLDLDQLQARTEAAISRAP